MPRICTSNSEPRDFCQTCFPSEALAYAQYGYMGDGPDGRGNCFEHDTDHPNYDDEEMGYVCEMCHTPLTAEDNHA
jgi:hypothetical protein